MKPLASSCYIGNPLGIIDLSLFLFCRDILFKRGGNFSSYSPLISIHIY